MGRSTVTPARRVFGRQWLADLTLFAASSGIYPWTAGHAFAAGDVPEGGTLGGLQLDVKSRWPDGSAKIALVSGVATLASTSATVPIDIGTAATGSTITTADLKATGIAAVFGTDVYGNATWASDSADWDAPFITWATGPVMSSWIYRKAIGSDAHLTAWMEVRMWSTGAVEVLPWIENGYLGVSSPTEKPGNYSFSLGGTTRFISTSLPVHHHTRAPLISGGTLSYWLGTDKTTTPKHSRGYLYATGLVQTYMSTVERDFGSISGGGKGVSAQFTPYEAFGSTVTIHSTVMGQGGGHPSIGVQPAWEAIALVSSDALGVTQCWRESFRMGQWQIHYRDEATNRPIRFSQRSDYQLRVGEADTLVNVYDRQDAGLTQTPAIVGTNNAGTTGKFQRSHQPAAPLMAYLTSGRFWFMEECQHIAAVNYLATAEQRVSGMMHCEPSIVPSLQQMRGAAWCMRNLVIAACVTPDGDSLKADLDASVDHNIDYYHGKYVEPYGSSGMNPLGLIECIGQGTNGGNQAWQYDFWTGAWGRAIAMRVGTSIQRREKARAFFDWISKSIVGRLGGTGSTEFFYRFAVCATNEYLPLLASRLWANSNAGSWAATSGGVTVDHDDGTYPDYAGGTGPWFASWGAFYDKWIVTDNGYSGGKVDGADLFGGDITDTTGWWAILGETIAACASLNAPGASAALARLRANTNWSTYVLTGTAGAYADQYPTNAADVTTLALESYSGILPAVGERSNISLNDATSVDYDATSGVTLANRWWNGYGGANSFASMVSSYSGTTHAPEYGAAGAAIVHGGGHGGNIGAFGYVFDFASRKWRCVGAPGNVPTTSAWSGWSDARNILSYVAANDLRDLAWLDYDHNGSYIKFSDHEYNQNGYVPPYAGGGPLGSLLLPEAHYHQDASSVDPRPGSSGDNALWAPHVMDLATGVMSRATAAPLGGWPGFATTQSFRDTKRDRIWYFVQSFSQAFYHPLGTLPLTFTAHTLKTQANATTALPVTQCAVCYCAEADAVIILSPGNQSTASANLAMGLTVLTMGTGVPVHRTDADLPTNNPMLHGGWNVGVAWHPALQKFYIYEGWGDTFCTTLTPSSLNFATCTWTWGKEDFGGASPINKAPLPQNYGNAGTEAPYGKWIYVPAYESFAWHDGPTTTGVCADGMTRDGVVQLWRAPGEPI